MSWLQGLKGLFQADKPAPGGRAVAVAAGPAPDWLARGNAALQQWDLAEAAECYRQAMLADPADPVARLNTGFVALEQGDAATADTLLTQALQMARPGDSFMHDACFLLGRAQQQQGRSDQALASFERAITVRPDFAEPIEAAIALLQQLQRHEEVLAWALRLRAARPAEAAMAAAQALSELGRPAEALGLLDELLAQEPEHPAGWSGRGQVLMALGRGEEALAAFERALALAGPSADNLTNAATALAAVGRRDEALARLADIVRQWPEDRNAALNQVLTLLEAARAAEAAQAARRALALHPQDADLHWAHAVAALLLGDFERGWQEHEWRFQARPFRGERLAPYPQPRWTGAEDLRGRTILLFAEQGLGDSIQFLRYLPLVAARAGQVLLHVPTSLEQLAAAAGLPANVRLLRGDEVASGFDYQCPLLSLPLAFATRADTVPAALPYLRADPQRVQAWRERLAQAGPPALNVGLTWSGNAAHANDRNRSVPLADFRGIAAAGCRFISLQPLVRPSDAAALADWPGLLPWGRELRSFMDTAALMEALDLVVTVDTSVAHLAGALGRPLWILLPYCPDWRWMLGREDSPWYPGARLFRQQHAGDWQGVLERVRRELATRAGGDRAQLG